MITETLGALGSWSLTLDDTTPDEVLRKIGLFGHIVILRGDVDVTQSTTAAVLAAARYVGVLRDRPGNSRVLEGASMRFWLGDEDNKGKVRETKLVFTAKSLTYCVTAALPAAVHLGTIHDPGGTYTGTHQWETPRQTLDTICAAFGVEYRVNGDGTVEVGTQAQLYAATPDSILSARGSGADMDIQSLGTSFQPTVSGIDYSTRIVLLGQTQDNATIVEATADAATVPYLDMFGNPVAFTRMISDSGQTTGSAAAAAQLSLNLFNRTVTTIKVAADDYDTQGNFVVGDNSYVFDPDNGIVDTTRELDFRGERINPAVVRISGLTWPVTEGHTVCFRAQDGTLLDLTRWVLWESGTTDITIGDLPKTLLGAGGNPVQERVNSVPDTSIPGAPTALSLSTTSVLSSKGQSTATVTATWTAPATNTDGTVITDLAYYIVQYRWHGRAPLWDTRYVPSTTIDLPGLAVGLVYDVQVAAVDLAGHVSAFTAVSSITAAPDTTAPNPPSDPTVGNYLGQLRIAWNGLDNVGGAMPSDFAIVEVHVSATSGFTPSTATLVSQLSTAGVAYATAPYSVVDNRYVKLVSVDNSGNRSAPSGQVSGHTSWVNTPDLANLSVTNAQISDLSVGKLTAGTMAADVIVGGRVATALTGARVEMNALGFQKFASDGVTKLISLTGSEALLTGTLKTALTGRRIEIGASGTTGEIDYIAPDGTKAFLRGFTTSDGTESVQLSSPVVGADTRWNSVQVDNSQFISLASNIVSVLIAGSSTGGRVFEVSYVPNFADLSTAGVSPCLNVFPESIDSYFDDHSGSTPGHFGVWAQDTSAGAVSRFYIDQVTGAGLARFNFPGTSQEVRVASAASDRSGSISLVHNIGGYGALLQYIADSGDGHTGYRFSVRDVGDTIYLPVWAQSFVVSSSKTTKTRATPFTGDALALVRSAKVKTYQRNGPTGGEQFDPKMKRDKDRKPEPPTVIPPGPSAPPGRTEIGLIAEEAPAEIVILGDDHTPMVDLYAKTSVMWAAIQQLADTIDSLTKGKAAA